MDDKQLDKRLKSMERGIEQILNSTAREFKTISGRFDIIESDITGLKKIIITGRFDKRIDRLEKDMDRVKEALAL